jgi:hypothetical protein
LHKHDSIEKKKNPANHLARFGAYPSSLILLAVSVQKFPIIVIIDQARIGYLNLSNPSGSINRLSDDYDKMIRGLWPDYFLVWCSEKNAARTGSKSGFVRRFL